MNGIRRTKADFITRHVVLPSDTVKLFTKGPGCGFGVVGIKVEVERVVGIKVEVVISSLHCAPVSNTTINKRSASLQFSEVMYNC